MQYLVLAARVMPFDHRIRGYLMQRTMKELAHAPPQSQ
jgi:hypothetical protein